MNMLRRLVCSLAILATLQLNAQTVMPLYEKEIPNAVQGAENKEKNTARTNDEWITDVSIPTLTYYPAENASPTKVAVIICPGGGYAGVAFIKEGVAVAKQFAQQGIAAFVLKYRMPNDRTMKDKNIGPLQDAQQAIKMVRDNAANWNIDPAKIGIMGFSAGGHLASTATTHFDKPVIDNKGTSVRPDFAMLIYPVITMKDSITHAGSRKNLIGEKPSPDKINLYSNEEQVTTTTPPVFMVHAGDDKTVPVQNVLLFYQALLKNKVKAEMLIFPGGGHGFGLNNPTTNTKWFDACIQWIQDSILKK